MTFISTAVKHSTMNTEQSGAYETIIICAGIVGCSCAIHLARAGREVLLIEADKPASKATGRSAGELGIYRSTDPENAVAQYGQTFYDDLAERHDTVDLHRNNRYKIAHSETGRQALDELDAEKQGGELLTPAELATRVPDFNTEAVTAGYVMPNAHTDPHSLTMALVSDCGDAGVQLRDGEPVQDLSKDGSEFVVETDSNTYETDVLVNATGSWSKQVAAKLDVSIPLLARTSQIAIFESDERVQLPGFACPDLNIYGRQELNGEILVGGGSSTTVDDLDSFSTKARESFIQEVADSLPKLSNALADARLQNSWAGRPSATPDRRPLIGETHLDGFYVCAGFNGSGVSQAPFAGRLLSDLVVGRESQFDPEPFDPKQYDGTEDIELLGSSTDW
jgi:sarcosine oxidase subunit beta